VREERLRISDAVGELNTFSENVYREATMKKGDQGTVYQCHYQFRGGEGKISLEGFEVLNVNFDFVNFANGLFERLRQSERFTSLGKELRRRIDEKFRERLAKEGAAFTDEETNNMVEQAVRMLELKLLKDSIETTNQMVSDKYQEFVIGFWEKILNLANFTGANALRDLLDVTEQKYSAKLIETQMQKLERARLKSLIGNLKSRGGSDPEIEVSDEQCVMFSTDYPALLKHWGNIKKWRKQGANWRGHAKVDFPDTPDDLLDRLNDNLPSQFDSDGEAYLNIPSVLAHEHAARRCGIPANTYSLSNLARFRRRGNKIRVQSKPQE
jgi:hypothetical protein